MIVRKAEEKDLNRINDIYNNLFDYENKNGSSTNWQRGVYPSLKNAEEKLAANELFVAEVNDEIIGSVVLNNEQLPEYSKFKWLFKAKDNEVGVIHTLCMDPKYFGKGYASKIVKFSEDYFRNQGCKVMRFD
ncbi:MAG: GNAT family N-acetyltransferase, partial [Bacilli bacterium]